MLQQVSQSHPLANSTADDYTYFECDAFWVGCTMDVLGFERRISETMHNAEGKRGPTDHLRRLAQEIEALRQDGVSWTWITRRLNAIRQDARPLTAHKVRSLWSGCKSGLAVGPGSTRPSVPGTTTSPSRPGPDWLEKAQARQDRTDARKKANR
jgi:hypothetical protein